jgi:type II secretory pathway pseudopilin PulG
MCNKINPQAYSNTGFSLVELLMALATSMIVLAAIYSVFTITNKNMTTQNVTANVQQSLRTAIGLMARDIRLAGLDPVDTDNFGIEEASQTKIRFTQDSIDPGISDFNGVVDETNFEQITYDLDLEHHQILQTLYETGASPNSAVLISNIKDPSSFTYLDADGNDLGNPVVDLDRIRTVVISITVEEPAGRNEPVSRTLTRKVECRNRGFN